jgi:hypothetical protein
MFQRERCGKVAQQDRTCEDGVRGCHVHHAAYASPESGTTQFVVWSFEPGPHIFLGIVYFVKSGLVRFVGMSKLRVEKCLSQITGALETLVEAIETHQDQIL